MGSPGFLRTGSSFPKVLTGGRAQEPVPAGAGTGEPLYRPELAGVTEN